MTKDIAKFCEKHGACEDGKQWALDNCKDMRDVWEKARPEWMIWVATRKGVLTDKQLRLFAVWCCRQIWNLMTDKRSRNAVEVAERYANGKATRKELAAAVAYAAAAAYAANAYSATYAYDAYDAYDAYSAAEREKQAKYLRDTYNPFGSKRK